MASWSISLNLLSEEDKKKWDPTKEMWNTYVFEKGQYFVCSKYEKGYIYYLSFSF